MAGRPKTRARQEAAARAAFGPAHDEPRSNVAHLPTTEARSLRAHDARAHARVRDVAAPRPMPLGGHTKQLVDESQRDRLRELSTMLEPETCVRIERLTPSWAAGVVEDATIEDGGLAELIDYMRAEHGGQRYKISVLSPDGHVLSVSKLSIPGPPRQSGKIVPRSRWSGDDTDEPRATNPTPSNGLSLGDITGLVSALAGAMGGDKRGEAELARLEREVRETREQLRDAIKTIQNPARQATPGNFAQQIGETLGTMRQLGKMRRALIDATGGDDDARGDKTQDTEASLLDGAIKKAASELIVSAVANRGARPQQAPAQQQPPPQRQAPRPSRMRRAEPDAE